MVHISIELWPLGDESKKRSLGHATIANDGTGTASVGNYIVTLYTPDGKRIWKRGKITGFERLSLGGWDLLYRGLRALVGERNP